MLEWFGIYGPSGKLLMCTGDKDGFTDYGMLLQTSRSSLELVKLSTANGRCLFITWHMNFALVVILARDINPIEERHWKECLQYIFEAQCHGLDNEKDTSQTFNMKLAKSFLTYALISPVKIGPSFDSLELKVEVTIYKFIRSSSSLPHLGFLDYQLLCAAIHVSASPCTWLLRIPNLANEGFIRCIVEPEVRILIEL